MAETIKEFIKACYNGPAPECAAYEDYQTPEEIRKIFYTLISFAVPDMIPLFAGNDYSFRGQGLFTDFVSGIIPMILSNENDDGTVATRADYSWIAMIDKMFEDIIPRSEEIYNSSYKEALLKHVTNIKNNISAIREMLTYSLLYSDNGFDVEMQIKNLCTFFGNIDIIICV